MGGCLVWEPMTAHDAAGPQTVLGHSEKLGRYAPDPQARRLYSAESRFGSEPPPGHQRFGNVREAANWAQALAAAPEFVAAYPQAAAWLADNPVSVKRASGRRKVGCAWVGSGEISLSSADDGVGMVLPVMVHEFSHIVHGRSPAEKFQQAHGPEFAAVYVDMVALVCGDDAARRLLADFEQKQVAVAVGARRVRCAGEGLAAAGRLPEPSRRRTPESVSAARDAHLIRMAEREARKAIKKYKPEHLRSFVVLNQGVFEEAAAIGADLPVEVRRHLSVEHQQPSKAPAPPSPLPKRPQPTRAAAAKRRPPQRGVCNKWMPVAKRRCSRPPHHNGGCR